MKIAHKRLSVEVQPSCRRDPNIVRCQSHGIPPRTSSAPDWNKVAPRRHAVCAAEGRAVEVTQDSWRGPEDSEWILDSRHWSIYTLQLWIPFDCDCVLVLPSWIKKVFNLFLILQELTVERLWPFKIILYVLLGCQHEILETNNKGYVFMVIRLYVKVMRGQLCWLVFDQLTTD